MERCPNCRARYGGEGPCRRCGLDLEALQVIAAKAEVWEQIAVERLAIGDVEGAEAATAKALALVQRPLAQRLQGFIRRVYKL